MWLWDPTEHNSQSFYNQRRFVANLAKSLEKHTTTISCINKQHDYKEIFKLTTQFLFSNIMPPLPLGNTDLQLAMDFKQFSCDKIDWILVGPNTSTVKVNTNYTEDGYETEHRFDTFQTLNNKEVLRIINKSSTKSFEIDALPMNLLNT